MLPSTLKGRLCCHARPLPPPCSSTSSLDTCTASGGLFCLRVSAVTLPQTNSAFSSLLLRTSGGSEGRTSSPYCSPFTNRATGLRARALLDQEENCGVDSSILEQQGRGTQDREIESYWKLSVVKELVDHSHLLCYP